MWLLLYLVVRMDMVLLASNRRRVIRRLSRSSFYASTNYVLHILLPRLWLTHHAAMHHLRLELLLWWRLHLAGLYLDLRCVQHSKLLRRGPPVSDHHRWT